MLRSSGQARPATESADADYEGPVRSDFERLFSHAEFRGHQVPITFDALAGLLGRVDIVVGSTASHGATMTAIGGYGLGTAAADTIAVTFADQSQLSGLVCDARPGAGTPPALHLFDRNGRTVHSVHASSYEDSNRILSFSGKPETGEIATPFAMAHMPALATVVPKAKLSHQTLFDLLDFVRSLRLPIASWVGTPHCVQRHCGAIDNLRCRAGCFRMWSNQASLSCDLTFAATIAILPTEDDGLAIALRDEHGHAFAGFSQADDNDERNRAFWTNLLAGMVEH